MHTICHISWPLLSPSIPPSPKHIFISSCVLEFIGILKLSFFEDYSRSCAHYPVCHVIFYLALLYLKILFYLISEQTPEPAEETGENPGVPSIRRREFYSEEIQHHAHVTMETHLTFIDVISNMNWRNFYYFAFLITASMFTSLGMEVPTLWMISSIATISLGLFMYLKLWSSWSRVWWRHPCDMPVVDSREYKLPDRGFLLDVCDNTIKYTVFVTEIHWLQWLKHWGTWTSICSAYCLRICVFDSGGFVNMHNVSFSFEFIQFIH